MSPTSPSPSASSHQRCCATTVAWRVAATPTRATMVAGLQKYSRRLSPRTTATQSPAASTTARPSSSQAASPIGATLHQWWPAGYGGLGVWLSWQGEGRGAEYAGAGGRWRGPRPPPQEH